MLCPVIDEEVVLVPALRAGVSMLSAYQRLLPKNILGSAHRKKKQIFTKNL